MKKLEIICGVYLIVNPSGRRYVGSAKDIYLRWRSHRSKPDKRQTILYNSFKKYGAHAHKFIILFKCEEDERLVYERIFGDMYLSLKDFGGMNMMLPGYNDIPQIFSEEYRKKISDTQRRISNRPERIEKQKEIAKKYLHSDEARIASRERMLNRYKDPVELEKQREQAKRFQGTEEVRSANRERAIERFSDPEKRKEWSDRMKEYYKKNPEKQLQFLMKRANNTNPWFHPQSRRVINTKSGQIFACAKEVIKAGDVKMDYTTFCERLRGEKKNDTIFMYLDQHQKFVA